MRYEKHNLNGLGSEQCEVYDMCPTALDPWDAVTNVPCPVAGCEQTICWYEAGYVPGYRVCMVQVAQLEDGPAFDMQTIKHRFFAELRSGAPVLIREPE